MSEQSFSVNDRAGEVCGMRPQGIGIDLPCELGYRCPVCSYEPIADGEYDARLDWSEYDTFLWCSVCNVDYPSALCLPHDVQRAINTYLDCVERLLGACEVHVR